MKHLAVTGSTGFIGRCVLQSLSKLHEVDSSDVGLYKILGISRQPPEVPIPSVRYTQLGVLSEPVEWQLALHGVETLVHCAARTHVMREQTTDALATFREVNVAGTLRLAHQAAAAGVQRLVFVSSIKVNGEATAAGESFTEADEPAPEDAYGQSKYEAEHALLALAAQTGMEVVIIRPPLVYGPGVKGNFAVMAKALQRGLPLPLGAVHNQRSLVALDNLVSLVLLCADRERSPQAANQVFVVADGEDVSTSTLLRKVARAAGRPSRLLPVPASWLRAGAGLLGKRAMADRLLGNLQVDATKARTLLGWRPVVTMDEQLAKMFEHKD
jgi:nucleoside-diphosphate-sugar epimerase